MTNYGAHSNVGHCPPCPMTSHDVDVDRPPISMAMMEKTFSALVLGDTLPKPTLVRLVQVKYRAEM